MQEAFQGYLSVKMRHFTHSEGQISQNNEGGSQVSEIEARTVAGVGKYRRLLFRCDAELNFGACDASHFGSTETP